MKCSSTLWRTYFLRTNEQIWTLVPMPNMLKQRIAVVIKYYRWTRVQCRQNVYMECSTRGRRASKGTVSPRRLRGLLLLVRSSFLIGFSYSQDSRQEKSMGYCGIRVMRKRGKAITCLWQGFEIL